MSGCVRQRLRIRSAAFLLCLAAAVFAAPPADAVVARRVAVPLDRHGAVSGMLHLRVAEDRGRNGTGTLVALTGATDRRASSDLYDLSSNLDELGARRVVTFDLRGTGDSGRLRCEALAGPRPLALAAADCAAELGPRRAFYTVADNVADLEAVRAALGVERISLYGLDFGAQVALAYATAHPEHVERLVLDGPVPPEGPDPSVRPTFQAIARVARDVCAYGCRFTHDTLGELTALLGRLAGGPLSARLIDGHGRPHRVSVDAADVRDVILAGDRSIATGIMWPAAVHAAVEGDAAPLARLAHTASGPAVLHGFGGPPLRGPGGPLLLARMCGGRTVGAAPPALPGDAFAPFTAAVASEVSPAAICAGWPDPPLTTPGPAMPSTIPTLVLSGERDIGTPLEQSSTLAARIPGAQLLAVPLLGHDLLAWENDALHDCPGKALAAFAEGAAIQPCPRPKVRSAWPFAPPRSFAEVRPRRGLPARVGRTVNAVQLTLLDSVYAWLDVSLTAFDGSRAVDLPKVLRFGGLRSGFTRIAQEDWSLHRYSFVPGVSVSAHIPASEDRAWRRIGGRDAVHGRLRLRGCGESDCFAGRLGGHRVRVRILGSA